MPDSTSPTKEDFRQMELTLTPQLLQKTRVVAKKVLWRITMQSGRTVKRAFDIVIAGSALIALSPLLLTISAIIKLTDGGPILFWQPRVGKWGKTFRFLKFRSMVVDAEVIRHQLDKANAHGSDGVTFKIADDPRITRIGRFIRRTSIDELPQLWCVLKGDMSLVGPRPAIPSEVERYTLDDRRRLDATPGLTCTWQVSGRADIPFPEQLRLDVEYIEQQSLTEDIRLLALTVPAVITGRGAY